VEESDLLRKPRIPTQRIRKAHLQMDRQNKIWKALMRNLAMMKITKIIKGLATLKGLQFLTLRSFKLSRSRRRSHSIRSSTIALSCRNT